MLDSLISRTRFYDITGYLIPGELLLGIAWLYIRVFGRSGCADLLLAFIRQNWVLSAIVLFGAGAYTIGHLVNSASKLLLEKWVLRYFYEKNADWYSRVKRDVTGRGDKILSRYEALFGYKAAGSKQSGRVIQGWAEQELPAPSLTTFRFLCFYGMNRTFALLTLLLIPPVSWWVSRHSHYCCMGWVILFGLLTSGLFLFQYLRFVKSYADSLPELLLMKH